MRNVIIISADYPVGFNKLNSMIRIAGKVKIPGCLGNNYTTVALISGYTFFDDFKGTVS